MIGKWPDSVTERLDLVFPDAPFPCEGKSEVENIFPPPYYEWHQFEKDFTEYRNLDACLKYIEDLIIERGPFDGLMGFSQGAILSAALPGIQAKGYALTKVPKIKFVVIVSGAKFRSRAVSEMSYSEKISCPSLHFLGELDFLRPFGEELLDTYVNPLVIHHPKGHTVPRILDEKSMETMNTFLERIEEEIQRIGEDVQMIEEAESADGLHENQQHVVEACYA